MLLLIPKFNVKSQSVPLHTPLRGSDFQLSLSPPLRAGTVTLHADSSWQAGKVEFSFFRVKGSDPWGTVAALILVWISIWFISFRFRLLTWASIQKLKGRSQHLVSPWWNKNCFECKIRCFSPRIPVAPTQCKLGRHLVQCHLVEWHHNDLGRGRRVRTSSVVLQVYSWLAWGWGQLHLAQRWASLSNFHSSLGSGGFSEQSIPDIFPKLFSFEVVILSIKLLNYYQLWFHILVGRHELGN